MVGYGRRQSRTWRTRRAHFSCDIRIICQKSAFSASVESGPLTSILPRITPSQVFGGVWLNQRLQIFPPICPHRGSSVSSGLRFGSRTGANCTQSRDPCAQITRRTGDRPTLGARPRIMEADRDGSPMEMMGMISSIRDGVCSATSKLPTSSCSSRREPQALGLPSALE